MPNHLDIDLKAISDFNFKSLIEIHLVQKEDVFFQAGRNLAREIYRKVWNTQNFKE